MAWDRRIQRSWGSESRSLLPARGEPLVLSRPGVESCLQRKDPDPTLLHAMNTTTAITAESASTGQRCKRSDRLLSSGKRASSTWPGRCCFDSSGDEASSSMLGRRAGTIRRGSTTTPWFDDADSTRRVADARASWTLSHRRLLVDALLGEDGTTNHSRRPHDSLAVSRSDLLAPQREAHCEPMLEFSDDAKAQTELTIHRIRITVPVLLLRASLKPRACIHLLVPTVTPPQISQSVLASPLCFLRVRYFCDCRIILSLSLTWAQTQIRQYAGRFAGSSQTRSASVFNPNSGPPHRSRLLLITTTRSSDEFQSSSFREGRFGLRSLPATLQRPPSTHGLVAAPRGVDWTAQGQGLPPRPSLTRNQEAQPGILYPVRVTRARLDLAAIQHLAAPRSRRNLSLSAGPPVLEFRDDAQLSKVMHIEKRNICKGLAKLKTRWTCWSNCAARTSTFQPSSKHRIVVVPGRALIRWWQESASARRAWRRPLWIEWIVARGRVAR